MTQEEFVRRIRACGQAIVDHAEDIANNYQYQTDLTVSFYMDFGENALPRIEVTSTFLPEGAVDKRFINHESAED